jgi:hypothetical protein
MNRVRQDDSIALVPMSLVMATVRVEMTKMSVGLIPLHTTMTQRLSTALVLCAKLSVIDRSVRTEFEKAPALPYSCTRAVFHEESIQLDLRTSSVSDNEAHSIRYGMQSATIVSPPLSRFVYKGHPSPSILSGT